MDLRVTVIQLNPGADKARNIEQAERVIGAALSDNPDVISLPEVWTCLGGDRAAKFDAAEELPAPGSGAAGGPAYEFLRDLARRRGIHVHGGSMGERDGERLFNTTVVFDRAGQEVARYRKLHLFDIVTPDGTGYRESAMFGAGEGIVTLGIGEVPTGLAICYDVRFPELFRALRDAGAELVFVPAAFTLQTGKDHWEVLLRARAIETQCWFAAAATWGQHADKGGQMRATYGNSLIADPWGQVVARVPDGIGWATARIERERTARIRRDMPVASHRRLG